MKLAVTSAADTSGYIEISYSHRSCQQHNIADYLPFSDMTLHDVPIRPIFNFMSYH